MKESAGIGHYFAARRYIKDFAKDYAERCGKDAETIRKDIVQAKKLNHISLGEYEWMGYDSMDQAQKESVSTLWTRAEYRKTFTDRRYISILMNKYIFSKVFGEFYGRECRLARDVDEAALRRMAGKEGKVIAKPNCQGQGKGIFVLPCKSDEDIKAALDFASTAENYIIEGYLSQHPVLNELNPGAVSILRFYSVSSPQGDYIFAPVLTAAINKDISNGCQDALTAMVDIRSGEVITQAIDQNELVEYEKHPVTGVTFRGLKLPYWQECIELLRKALPLANKISNIGWDLAITEDGPVIVEANTIPGFNTAQYKGYSWVTQGYGYQPLFDLGMKGTPLPDDGRYDRVLLKLS